jgi:hypothetical protein
MLERHILGEEAADFFTKPLLQKKLSVQNENPMGGLS